MIIGSHETFIGTKQQSVISSVDFEHYPSEKPSFIPSLYDFDFEIEVRAQAP